MYLNSDPSQVVFKFVLHCNKNVVVVKILVVHTLSTLLEKINLFFYCNNTFISKPCKKCERNTAIEVTPGPYRYKSFR